MSNTWLTSDNHWGHFNINKFCNRPFSSMKEMDEALITYWNDRVKENDYVFHLGDLTLSTNISYIDTILKSLNGKIFMIKGNHDRFLKKKTHHWRFEGIVDYHEFNINHKKIIMCHYPLLSWRSCHYGSYHFYGHSHGSRNERDKNNTRIDVGVDCWDYRPVNLDILLEILSKRKYQGDVDYTLEEETNETIL